jgi:hypothetical protein
MEFTQEQKLYAQIVQKAWEDADFKTALAADPLPTIENFLGKKLTLPEGKTLVVRDQTDESTVYINIPSLPEIDAELSEEELEAVSGGTAWMAVGPWVPNILPIPIIISEDLHK